MRESLIAYQRSQPLISIHIPKCAGTSFTNVLRTWFWPGFHAHYIAHDQDGRLPGRARLFKQVLFSMRLTGMCIHGHFEDEAHVFDYYPNASQFITVIRDPLEMQLSLFWDHKRRINEFGSLYWKGEKVEMEYGGDINRWVAERPCFLLQFFPWQLTSENFREVLEQKFVHIGVTEKLQDSVNHFANRLGKPKVKVGNLNQSRRDTMPSAEAVEAFKDRHTLEYAIYDWAIELNS